MVITTMSQIIMILPGKDKDKIVGLIGFTLLELVIVLAIISGMVAVVIPFAKRSSDGLKTREQSQNMAQTIRYAIDLAQNNRRAVKFIFNSKNKSYCLEADSGDDNFELAEGFLGSIRYMDKDIYISDIDGFSQDGKSFFLIFDPKRPWPTAWLSLATKDSIETIKINGKNVQIEETGI